MMQGARNRIGWASLHLRTARSPRGSERHRKAWKRQPGAFFLQTASEREPLRARTRAQARCVSFVYSAWPEVGGTSASRILGPNLFPFTSTVSRAKRCTDPRKRGFNGIS
jgi:hypothetical protein